MKKSRIDIPEKKLELKKTAVARLNLTFAELQSIVGGDFIPNTPDASKAANETQCTGQTHPPPGGNLLTSFI